MAILENVNLYYARLDPKRPNNAYNKENPTWELQIRTSDPAQMQSWKEVGLLPKLIKYKDDYEDAELAGTPVLTEDGKKQWRVNLQKRSKKADGTAAAPVEVVNGSLEPINPRTIANESKGNVRLFMREYEQNGEKKLAPVLMAVQITHLVEYEPSDYEQEGFNKTTTTVVKAAANNDTGHDDSNDDNDGDSFTKQKAPSTSPAVKSNKISLDDDDAY